MEVGGGEGATANRSVSVYARASERSRRANRTRQSGMTKATRSGTHEGSGAVEGVLVHGMRPVQGKAVASGVLCVEREFRAAAWRPLGAKTLDPPQGGGVGRREESSPLLSGGGGGGLSPLFHLTWGMPPNVLGIDSERRAGGHGLGYSTLTAPLLIPLDDVYETAGPRLFQTATPHPVAAAMRGGCGGW